LKERLPSIQFEITKEKEMADFRKWILVLAALAVIMVPVTASAQAPGCQVNAYASALQPIVRANGLAELIGDIYISNFSYGTTTGCPSGESTLVIVNVSFHNYITNILSAGNVTDAILIDQDNGDSVNGTLVGATGLTFQLPTGEPLPTAGTVYRITNVRLNVSTAPALQTITGTVAMLVGQSNEPTPNMFQTNFNNSSQNPLGQGPVVQVAFPQQGDTFTTSGSVTDQQCNTKSAPGDPSPDFTVSFTAGFQDAFKTLQYEGLTDGEVVSDWSASQGTRLYTTFTNIPAGATVYVTKTSVSASSGEQAMFVGQDNTAEGTGSIITPVSGWVALTPAANGSATAVWEITSMAVSGYPNIQFGVYLAYDSGTVALTTATAPLTAVGGFAPLSVIQVASASTVPVPRFGPDSNAPATGMVTVDACVTNLLFPYVVTGNGGWNTGIAIVNTSKDSVLDSEATQQAGICTLYFYGSGAPATPVVWPHAADPVATIASGTVFAAVVSADAPAFDGYIIAICNFQYAHGYAYIEGTLSSQGYLALILERGLSRRDRSESLDH
jgi:hypothetical protein